MSFMHMLRQSVQLLIWSSILAGASGAAAAFAAEPFIALQQAVRKAQIRVALTDQESAHLHQETLTALARLERAGADAGRRAGAVIAFEAAERREAAQTISAVQATAAFRRARQALNEAVNVAVEQGDALERAAARAARGEVAPSVSDLLACDGPDCQPVSVREHAALVLMGAVGPAFDPAKWPQEGATPPVSVLAYAPAKPPLVILRRAVDDATQRARAAGREVARLRDALRGEPESPVVVKQYAAARAEADAAAAERADAEARLSDAVRDFANAGRSLKRAALLAGDGYVLKSGGRRVCSPTACAAADGLEAAAFIVLGAAENPNDGLKHFGTQLAPTPAGGFVFR